MKTVKRIVTAIAVAMAILYLVSLPLNNWNIRRMNLLGYSAHIVASGSMIPEFKPGDIILTRTVDFQDVEVGDIITYLNDNMIIVHRVIDKTDSYIQTQGDNNKFPDAVQITQGNLLGKVLYHTNF